MDRRHVALMATGGIAVASILAYIRHARARDSLTGFFNILQSEQVVLERNSQDLEPRLAEIMGSVVRHLHAFVKEVRLTEDEWSAAIDFLTKTGHTCSGVRQEFILASDTLGVSMLVDALNHQRPAKATENTVLGPFHVPGSPIRQMGESIVLDGKGELCLFRGCIRDLDGNPIAGAMLDVWSDNGDGFYDVQQPDIQPQWNNRGRFVTGADGAYHFIGIKPVPYPIPDDGPVGRMLRKLGRHPYRPAHVHFIVTANGYQKIVTHTFANVNQYLASDCVFGVKSTLVASYDRLETARVGDVQWTSHFDFVMCR